MSFPSRGSRMMNVMRFFSVKGVVGQIVGRLGSTVSLPCWISPPLNAERLEIRWYRPEGFNTPVLFYSDGKMQEVWEERYRNCSCLSRRSSQSDGLKDGDVSLRLENVTVQDDGLFYCYSVDDKHMNISCRSSSWFPEPNVMWMSDRRRFLSAGGHSHSRGADGTLSVHRSLSLTLHRCSVFCPSTVEMRELDIHNTVTSSRSDGPWKTLYHFCHFCYFYFGSVWIHRL
ncbi:selection and upkeep of intraepithelial T-cells protein 1-like [Triplophysa dalaica]|uniref:selection and upkeep of intraepithelial T-cells protein 1-like n=1 Tax=Triplophysa dalaica TaxID=1582913 RepID=UPI0024DFD3CB|nr:selection and upkeep of intraepithelial T-cells protein 1-like [Triplophysa dalaica]